MAKTILLTGATGYIGGRLAPVLIEGGYKVRCLVRNRERLDGFYWSGQAEGMEGDASDYDSLVAAMKGVDVAYFLIHSMSRPESHDFAEKDRELARNFARAAEECGVSQIVYLGGLGSDEDDELSKHLSSRQEVGQLLASTSVPVTELRAAIIIGAGSSSFELLRQLVDMLPVMVAPKWLTTKCQPIAVRDMLWYLCEVIDDAAAMGKVLEVGGEDVTTYKEMMLEYGRIAGLRKRRILTLPVLTPHLSSLWVGLITSLPPSLAKALILGLKNEVIVNDHTARQLFDHKQMTVSEAIIEATESIRTGNLGTTWADAELEDMEPQAPLPTDPEWAGPELCTDARDCTVSASVDDVWKTVTGIGGKRGWFTANQLWALRGAIDKIWGGVGSKRGRRHPDELRTGDIIDFWRVERMKENELLRLRAEMRLPGPAWLEWELHPSGDRTAIKQTATFYPSSIFGKLYWSLLTPFHNVIFKRMLASICYRAENGLYGDQVVGKRLPRLGRK